MAEELIEAAQQQRTYRAKLNARKTPRRDDDVALCERIGVRGRVDGHRELSVLIARLMSLSAHSGWPRSG